MAAEAAAKAQGTGKRAANRQRKTGKGGADSPASEYCGMAKKRARPTSTRGLAARQSRSAAAVPADRLLSDIRGLIEQAREGVAKTVNAAMVALYWNIGKRIREGRLARAAGGVRGADC